MNWAEVHGKHVFEQPKATDFTFSLRNYSSLVIFGGDGGGGDQFRCLLWMLQYLLAKTELDITWQE